MYRYKIPTQFPVGEEIPIPELARRCNADEGILTRLVQHAVTRQFLAQQSPGHVSHSALSAMLTNSPGLLDCVGLLCEDLWPAATRVLDAVDKWPGPPWLPTQTGHNLAENKTGTFFDTIAEDAPRAARFDRAMATMQTFSGGGPARVFEAFDWAALGPESTVVDVGGGNAAFATKLAEQFPNIGRIVVQDVAETVAKAQPALSDTVRGRVTMQAHDFFEPQPVEGADVYFLRRVLHDWPDEFAAKMLRQLIPALKPGAVILINEFCLPPVGVLSRYTEWHSR